MNIKNKCRNKINGLIKRSYWYNNIAFPDCKKFWNLNQFDLDVVNLGSTSGSYAFNYHGVDLKCANWALAPKSLLLDYEVLRNYFSYLKKGATVIIPLCPFSCLVGYNSYIRDYMYTIIRHNSIPHFQIQKRVEMMEIMRNPLNHYPFIELGRELKLFFRRLLGKKRMKMSSEQFVKDADNWIRVWKNQFSISNLDDDLSLVNKDSYEEAVIILSKLIDFCLSRDLKPIVVIPPVTKHLYERFTKRMIKINIEEFIDRANIHNIPFLNYLNDEQLNDDRLYINSFFLNSEGAKLFTCKVLEDIGIVVRSNSNTLIDTLYCSKIGCLQ